jgi:hypothetical protein
MQSLCQNVSKPRASCLTHMLKWTFVFNQNLVWRMERDRECTCNVMKRRVRVTIVAVKKSVFWVCICTISFPAFKAHVLCYVVCGLSGLANFSTYLLNGTIFRNSCTQLCVIIFFTNRSETFLILRKIGWDIKSIDLHTKYQFCYSVSRNQSGKE